MTTRKLTVLKPGKYGTRHLTAGQEFELPIREAAALVVKRKAKFVDKTMPRPRAVAETGAKTAAQAEPEPKAPEPHAIGAMTAMLDIDRLRQQAMHLGINVDNRWGVPRLRHEIEIAQEAKR